MKRITAIIAVLFALMGVKAQTTWDFSATYDDDIAALSQATSEWSYTEASERYECTKDINGPLTAGGIELQLTKGLKFTAAAKKLRIDVGKRIQLAGKNVVIIIPGLKKGQIVTVKCASTGNTAVTLDNQVNLTGVSGFVAADKNTTQTGTGTVAQDGDVQLSSTISSLNVFSISVSEAPDNGEETGDNDVVNNNVPMNLNQNQAIITLHSNDVKYYNTNELAGIDIDDQTNKVTINTLADAQDVYNGSVKTITFSKAADQGESGEINNGGVEITESKGWLESLYAKWKPLSGATSYNVYVKGGKYNDWTKIDQQLVRNYDTYGRADVVGLVAASDYSLKVVPVIDETEDESQASTVENIIVKNYSRQGFAFMNNYSPGAYNSDGSLKAGAKVFYVTKKTAKTISTTVAGAEKNPCVGLQAIIAGYEKGGDKTPIAFRFIGLVEKDDLDAIGSSEEGIQVKGRRADSELNITFEGIGEDATVKGFGFLVRNSKSVEFRNFAIMRCMDDGISLDTDNANIWIHHMDMFYGKHGSGDHDKGDGAIDVKSDSKYVTVSYNHEWDTGKSNMFGMKSESGPNYISYDHNWFDHADSRHPRVRTMSVHVWNNYFDNVAKYGVGACTGSSVFVENNYFLKTKKPILSSNQGTDALGSGTFSGEDGGMIKAYGNYFDRSAKNFRYYTQNNPASTGYDAYETDSRDEEVPSSEKTRAGGTTYDNFDTNSSVMFSYTPDEAAEVPAIVTGYYGAGRLNHGDFQYTGFNDNTGDEEADSAYDTTLGSLLDNYKSSLMGFFGDENGGGDEPGGDEPGGDDQPEGTITASFDGSPSHSMFTVKGDYGDGKITYGNTYYKKGVKLNSNGSIAFTPNKDYDMTLVLATAKTGRNVNINGEQTTVSGTENSSGAYYEMQSVSINKDIQYTITKGSAESIVMLIILKPKE